MSYTEIMDQYVIEHGDAWRQRFEHARLYNYLPPFTDEVEFMQMAIFYTREKGYKAGYAAVLFKEMFKRWPANRSWMRLEPLKPGEDFNDWMDAKQQRMRVTRRKPRKKKRKSEL